MQSAGGSLEWRCNKSPSGFIVFWTFFESMCSVESQTKLFGEFWDKKLQVCWFFNGEFMRRSKVVETWKVVSEFVKEVCGEYQDQTVDMPANFF